MTVLLFAFLICSLALFVAGIANSQKDVNGRLNISDSIVQLRWEMVVPFSGVAMLATLVAMWSGLPELRFTNDPEWGVIGEIVIFIWVSLFVCSPVILGITLGWVHRVVKDACWLRQLG